MDNINMDILVIGWNCWIDLIQDMDMWRALENAVMILRFPSKSGNFMSACTTRGLSNSAQLHRVSQIRDTRLSVLFPPTFH
jgi:hypothetical protein